MGSKPEYYYDIPEAISYYRNFPSEWDDIAFIDGDISHYIDLARKSGNNWYAAGISVDAKTISYKPTFLDNNKYIAVIYHEADNDYNYEDYSIEAETRKFGVSVNGSEQIVLNCEGNNSWEIPMINPVVTQVELKDGEKTSFH